MSIQASIKRDFLNDDFNSQDYEITEIEIKSCYANDLDNDTNAFLNLNIDDLV